MPIRRNKEDGEKERREREGERAGEVAGCDQGPTLARASDSGGTTIGHREIVPAGNYEISFFLAIIRGVEGRGGGGEGKKGEARTERGKKPYTTIF